MRETKGINRPIFNNVDTLDFDAIGAEEQTDLTREEKCEKFISRWMYLVDPIVKYDKYFKLSGEPINKTIHSIKIYYGKFVLDGEWSDEKYATVVDAMLAKVENLYPVNFNSTGKLYDNQKLPSQIATKRAQKRRKPQPSPNTSSSIKSPAERDTEKEQNLNSTTENNRRSRKRI